MSESIVAGFFQQNY